MANPEHVELVRLGTEALREWQQRNGFTPLDLVGADLRRISLLGADLSGADLSGTIFSNSLLGGANVSGAKLLKADFTEANLIETDLSRADASGAIMFGVRLSRANLTETNFTRADLSRADLMATDLFGANLSGADLFACTLLGAELVGTIFTEATCGMTVFGDVDLSLATHLGTARHVEPSTIGIDTLTKSKGRIPDAFLRGCGLSDWEILAAKLYAPGLGRDDIDRTLYEISTVRSGSPIQISPLFISCNRSGPRTICWGIRRVMG